VLEIGSQSFDNTNHHIYLSISSATDLFVPLATAYIYSSYTSNRYCPYL